MKKVRLEGGRHRKKDGQSMFQGDEGVITDEEYNANSFKFKLLDNDSDEENVTEETSEKITDETVSDYEFEPNINDQIAKMLDEYSVKELKHKLDEFPVSKLRQVANIEAENDDRVTLLKWIERQLE